MQTNYYLVVTATMQNKRTGELNLKTNSAVPAESMVNVIKKFNSVYDRVKRISTRKVYFKNGGVKNGRA